MVDFGFAYHAMHYAHGAYQPSGLRLVDDPDAQAAEGVHPAGDGLLARWCGVGAAVRLQPEPRALPDAQAVVWHDFDA